MTCRVGWRPLPLPSNHTMTSNCRLPHKCTFSPVIFNGGTICCRRHCVASRSARNIRNNQKRGPASPQIASIAVPAMRKPARPGGKQARYTAHRHTPRLSHYFSPFLALRGICSIESGGGQCGPWRPLVAGPGVTCY